MSAICFSTSSRYSLACSNLSFSSGAGAVLHRLLEVLVHLDRLVEVEQRERQVVVDRGVVPVLERLAVLVGGGDEQAVVELGVALGGTATAQLAARPPRRLGPRRSSLPFCERLVGAGLLVGLVRRRRVRADRSRAGLGRRPGLRLDVGRRGRRARRQRVGPGWCRGRVGLGVRRDRSLGIRLLGGSLAGRLLGLRGRDSKAQREAEPDSEDLDHRAFLRLEVSITS